MQNDPMSFGWVSGPAVVPLGEVAQIEVPAGYRFIGAAGARYVLKQMNNPVPRGTVGILALESGGWWSVLEYTDTGYFKGVTQSQVDSGRILEIIRKQVKVENNSRDTQAQAGINSVNWELYPAYNAVQHSLEWAIRAETRLNGTTEQFINHTVRLLGRHGVLAATAVSSGVESGKTSQAELKKIVQNIQFKPGEGYSDYLPGDKIADIGITEFIAGADPRAGVLGLTGIAGLFGIGSAFAGTAVVGVALARRRKLILSHSNGLVHHKTPPPPRAVRAVPAPVVNPSASRSRHRSDPRKKVFDYQRFYCDMMAQVSPSVYPNTSSPRTSRARSENPEAGAPEEELRLSVVKANSQLIADQTRLLMEQLRLLREQTRLIEEKNKLLKGEEVSDGAQSELFQIVDLEAGRS